MDDRGEGERGWPMSPGGRPDRGGGPPRERDELHAAAERAKIRERTQRGRRARVASGKPIAGPRPAYGYVWNADKSRYLLDRRPRPVVRLIFDWALDGRDSAGHRRSARTSGGSRHRRDKSAGRQRCSGISSCGTSTPEMRWPTPSGPTDEPGGGYTPRRRDPGGTRRACRTCRADRDPRGAGGGRGTG